MSDAIKPRFAGVVVTLGGTDYTVPPLAIGQLKTLQAKIESLTVSGAGVPSSDRIDDVLDIIQAALSRNYPDITRAELEELIDLGNIGAVTKIVTGVSGLEKRDANGALSGNG